VEAGAVALKFQDRMFRDLNCKRIQVDELWGFIGAKQKNVTPEIAAKNPNAGDIWLWVAIDADTKIVPAWMLGGRDAGVACEFLYDLRQRLANRVQLTSDGHKAYLQGVDYAWGGMNIDYAMLVKLYGAERPGEARYSPAECIGCKATAVIGNPDPEHVSTSFVERQNLNVRMGIRRYTRLTNAFSRKIENHSAAVALYYFAYNFINIHRTLRTTPAMAAGVTDRLWEASDLVAMLESDEAGLGKAA
jgi:IS1 family transposase